MRWLSLYRFPILTVLTWIVFLSLVVFLLSDSKIISFKGNDVQITKKNGGTHGKFSFKLMVLTNGKKLYNRSYKSFALSNVLLDLKNHRQPTPIWLVVSKNNSSKNHFYTVVDHNPSVFRVCVDMISYLLNNYTIVICLPLVVTLLLCSQEFGRDYQFINQQHKTMITYSYYFNALFIALIALY